MGGRLGYLIAQLWVRRPDRPGGAARAALPCRGGRFPFLSPFPRSPARVGVDLEAARGHSPLAMHRVASLHGHALSVSLLAGLGY